MNKRTNCLLLLLLYFSLNHLNIVLANHKSFIRSNTSVVITKSIEEDSANKNTEEGRKENYPQTSEHENFFFPVGIIIVVLSATIYGLKDEEKHEENK